MATIVGLPGSGKSFLANIGTKEFDFEILSTGNFCRKQIFLGTAFGKNIEEFFENKKLVPDYLITSFVFDWLITRLNIEKKIVFDGFPRTIGQLEIFLDFLTKFNLKSSFKVLHFEVKDLNLVEKRLKNRVICSNKNCQKNFLEDFFYNKKRICPFCGSFLEKRKEDSFFFIKERLNKNSFYIDKILEFYNIKGFQIESFFDIQSFLNFLKIDDFNKK